MNAKGLAIARVTVREAVSRRIVLWGLVLSALYVALFAVGFALLYGLVEREPAADDLETTFAATLLTVLGLYVTSFLASFLALFLSAGSVSAEVDSGTLQAVLARPLRRSSWLLQRWAASAALVAAYTGLIGGALLVVARLVAGYAPVGAARAVGLMVFQALLLLTLGMLGSTRLSTVANGVALFFAFGLAWLAGIVEFIGANVANAGMENIGIAVSLLIPSDGLWRAASYYAAPSGFLVEAASAGGLPFAAVSPPAPAFLAWATVYVAATLALALRSFARRDL